VKAVFDLNDSDLEGEFPEEDEDEPNEEEIRLMIRKVDKMKLNDEKKIKMRLI
jgi:hypothetical protein